MAENPIEREFVFTRSFKAPPSVVFKAWTDLRQMVGGEFEKGLENLKMVTEVTAKQQ